MNTLNSQETLAASVVLFLALTFSAIGSDWPMLGRGATRNAVSPEKRPPLDWDVGKFDDKTQAWMDSRNVKWTAPLGSQAFGDPVVADGLVWIGTNNQRPPFADKQLAGVLKCFRESDGKLLYEYVSPALPNRVNDNGWGGLGCSPLIEGDHVWFTTNRCETVCLDIGPLKRNQGEPKIVWKYDMIKELGVFPRATVMGPARTCSIGSYKEFIYVTTTNGVDDSGTNVPAPKSPSLICFNKSTGKVIWTDNSPGENILRTQVASPLVVEIGGRGQVIAPQGDGWVRSFDALRGQLIWEFDINLKKSKWEFGGRGLRNEILATPVFYGNRVYVASGQGMEHEQGLGRLCCIDPTKRGDISAELAVDANGKSIPHRRIQAVNPDAGERAIANANSGLIWEFTELDENGDGKIEFEEQFHRTVASVAIKDGLLIAADTEGLVHCIDAKTGQRHWKYDPFACVYAPPLIVDDKIYLADEDGGVSIFNLSADPKKAMKETNSDLVPINARLKVDDFEVKYMDSSIYTSPIFADGTLYIVSRSTLFAIQAGDKEAGARNDQPNESRKPGFWPQWRGPSRNNISPDERLLTKWPDEGPPLLWKAEDIGEGFPSVAVAGGRVFLVGYHDESEHTIALDERTGQRLWDTEVKTGRVGGIGMSVMNQRTPTVDDDRLYVVARNGKLFCLNSADGKPRWQRDFVEDFSGTRGFFGYGTFLLIDGDRLICTPGGEKSPIVALNKQTGETIWQSTAGGKVKRPGHSATVIAEVGGVRQYIQNFSEGTVAVAANDGRFLWHYNRIKSGQGNAHTPIVRGDHVLCTNGWGTGIGLLKLAAEGRGIKAEELYFERAPLDHWLDSTVVVEDHFYLCSYSGRLLCYDMNSGAMAWAGDNPVGPRPRMTYADGHLYLHGIDGSVALVEANPKAYVEKSVVKFDNRRASFTFPVVTGGRLFLRHWDTLFCYDVTQGGRLAKVAGQKPSAQSAKSQTIPGSAGVNPSRPLRSVFVPTPQDVVERMLTLADVKKTDLVVDLGSGDGRIVNTAARKYGARAVGYEIDKDLVELSCENAVKAKVESLVTFHNKDLFTADLTQADVVAVYLLPKQLDRLLPQLQKLKPGARIVSHQFELPSIKPNKTIEVESDEDGDRHKVHLWIAPLKK